MSNNILNDQVSEISNHTLLLQLLIALNKKTSWGLQDLRKLILDIIASGDIGGNDAERN